MKNTVLKSNNTVLNLISQKLSDIRYNKHKKYGIKSGIKKNNTVLKK